MQTSLDQVMSEVINSKLQEHNADLENRFKTIEEKLLSMHSNPYTEILQQKEVFEIMGIGRRKLKRWVENGLKEFRIDNRVYYKYSDLLRYIENPK